MVLIRVEIGTWKDRVGKAASAVVLSSLIFMLGAAGSKNSPSLPPTLDPAVACKRPKTATPYFPYARARDLLRARLARFTEASGLEADPDSWDFTSCQGPQELERHDHGALTSPRYLRPHLASALESSASPPA